MPAACPCGNPIEPEIALARDRVYLNAESGIRIPLRARLGETGIGICLRCMKREAWIRITPPEPAKEVIVPTCRERLSFLFNLFWRAQIPSPERVAAEACGIHLAVGHAHLH